MPIIPIDSNELKSRLQLTGCENGIFLASASYEPRSTAIVETLPKELLFSVGLVYANEEFLQEPEGKAANENFNCIASALQITSKHVAVEKGSWLDPLKQLSSLKNLVMTASQEVRDKSDVSVYVDTTAFTRESLIVACALIRRHISYRSFAFLHSTPKAFGSWLSRGFREIRNIMGFAGHQVPGMPTVLVVLSGFEAERASRIIDAHEPSCVLLGIGNPPTDSSFLERNLKEQKVILARQDVKPFDFPANSIDECVKSLESVIHPYLASANVVIAPMSTKLSTIAAMIIAEKYPSIQLTYCVPGEYNIESYSAGAKSILFENM